MKTLADVSTEFGLQREELLVWIEKRWVLPLDQSGDYTFAEADLARVQMIVDLRRDLAIDDDALPVVLDLLDKLYGLRRQMRDLLSAIDELPDTQRDMLLKRIGAGRGESEE
jgi:chaperone modulatory protein CbpM